VVVKDFDKLQPDDETMRLREDLLTNVDQIADEKAISGDPTKEHIKEMIRSYTWVQKYERLKELANTMRTDYYLTEDEITEIQLIILQRNRKIKEKVGRFNCCNSNRWQSWPWCSLDLRAIWLKICYLYA